MHKNNIKKLIIFLIVFTMFFINFRTVSAETITCNYSDSSNGTGYIMEYNNEKLTLTPSIKVKSSDAQPIDIRFTTPEFTVNAVKDGCPSSLYSLISSTSTGQYDMKFFLSADSAKTYASSDANKQWKNSMGTLATLELKDNKKQSSSCEYFEITSGVESPNNKLIIYYDVNNNSTPEISIDGKFSSDVLEIKPNFNGITSCPPNVYTAANTKGSIDSIVVYLDAVQANNASKYFKTYSNSKYGNANSSEINKIDDDNLDLGSGTFTIDCSSFSALHTVYVMILILAPIAVIVLGSIDFAKAVMTSDEEKMKKFKSKFPKRVIALVLLFVTPFIINAILEVFTNSTASTMLCITKGYSDPITIQASSEKSESETNKVPTALKSACSKQCSSTMSPTVEIQCTNNCVNNYKNSCENIKQESEKKKCYKTYAKKYKSSNK